MHGGVEQQQPDDASYRKHGDQQQERHGTGAALALRDDAEAGSLNAKAERALAYAKIYAASDPDLSGRIAELGGKKRPPSAANAEPVARRGRHKKAPLESELFSGEHGARDVALAEGH